mmetsp:Transcript_6037/g.14279  ORF Transcript_6037/g.14279 Transcript_6037/m.14279 type:complete len:159 (+) Transcript_6037:36-512(+)
MTYEAPSGRHPFKQLFPTLWNDPNHFLVVVVSSVTFSIGEVVSAGGDERNDDKVTRNNCFQIGAVVGMVKVRRRPYKRLLSTPQCINVAIHIRCQVKRLCQIYHSTDSTIEFAIQCDESVAIHNHFVDPSSSARRRITPLQTVLWTTRINGSGTVITE